MTYTCPHCGEILSEEEAESVCDCGCPSCRYYIHNIEDYENEEDDNRAGSEVSDL